MGRNKLDCPKGRLRLNAGSDNNTPYPLMYEYSTDGLFAKKTTGYKVKIKDWNKKEQMIRASYGEDFARVNNILHRQLRKWDEEIEKYNEKNPHQVNILVIKRIINNDASVTRNDEGKDFSEYVLEHLDNEYRQQHHIGYSRYCNGVSSIKIFEEFLTSTKSGTYKKDKIYLGEISPNIINSFIKWRRDIKKNEDTTINHSLTPIIKAVRNAADEGLIDLQLANRIKKCRIEVKTAIDSDNEVCDRYLSIQQIEKLKEYYKICQEPRRKEFIEMYLFAFYACGLRTVDIMTLRFIDINFDKKCLRKVQVKTRKDIIIPLNDQAMNILRKWRNKRPDSKFVFDLVDDTLNLKDDDAIYKARNNADKCINQSLVVVGESLELPFRLTMYTARHSFAIYALNPPNNLSMSLISALLGHSSSAVTEKIYAKYLPATIDEELKKLHFTEFNPID